MIGRVMTPMMARGGGVGIILPHCRCPRGSYIKTVNGTASGPVRGHSCIRWRLEM